jgi:hypothetical protein
MTENTLGVGKVIESRRLLVKPRNDADTGVGKVIQSCRLLVIARPSSERKLTSFEQKAEAI